MCVWVCSYYRFVLEPELEFTEDTGTVSGPFAQFDGLPLKPLLTVGMDPPESWLVESVHAVYDLDNICMDEVSHRCCLAVSALSLLSQRSSGWEFFVGGGGIFIGKKLNFLW